MPALPARYRAQRLIKRGGTAEVYEALLPGPDGLERRVALKRLLPGWAQDPSLRSSFFDEAKIASQLSHPNLITLLDFGVLDERPFQVLEYVDGLSLTDVMERRQGQPLSVPLALYLVRELANGLAYVHRATDREGRPLGLVHRDVTANNVLVSYAGDVKLGDFGIAYALRRAQITKVGFTKGTAAFMAPEQAMGAPVEARTDLFSAGCLLHWLLAGESPIADANVRARAYAGESVALDPRVPPGVATVIGRCLRLRPEQRYPSADALGEALWIELRDHLAKDPRVSLRELMERLRPNAQRAAHPVGDLFDLQLLESLGGDQPVRRFSSIVRPPPPRDPSWATASNGVASAEAATAVVHAESVEPPLPPTALSGRGALADNAITRAVDPTTLPGTRLIPEPVGATRVVAFTQRPFPWSVGILAFVLMLGLGIGLGISLRRPPPSSIAPRADLSPALGVTASSTAGPVVSPRAADPPGVDELEPIAIDPLPAEEGRGRTNEGRRPRRIGARPEADPPALKVEQALKAKQLRASDLSLDPAARTALQAWRRAEGAARTGAELRLLTAIEAFRVEPAALEAELAALEELLRQILSRPGSPEPASLDRRLIDLRVAAHEAKDPNERLVVARRIRGFVAELRSQP
ncbi:MAG: protein kinase [Deltaproteobacteria bacterium]|nr:protein kinase [Deltaproteobacteria bacterium]